MTLPWPAFPLTSRPSCRTPPTGHANSGLLLNCGGYPGPLQGLLFLLLEGPLQLYLDSPLALIQAPCILPVITAGAPWWIYAGASHLRRSVSMASYYSIISGTYSITVSARSLHAVLQLNCSNVLIHPRLRGLGCAFSWLCSPCVATFRLGLLVLRYLPGAPAFPC